MNYGQGARSDVRTSQMRGFEFLGMWILGGILGFDVEFQDFTGILNGFYSHEFYGDFTNLMQCGFMIQVFFQDQKKTYFKSGSAYKRLAPSRI